ncbi:hypothetical protein ACTFIY_003485 [Dictyostelium cf. discoideum]
MLKNLISLNNNNVSKTTQMMFRSYTSHVSKHRLIRNPDNEKQVIPPRENKLFEIKLTNPLQYPIQPITSDVLYGPKSSELTHPDIPFIVNRTKNDKLPIYTDILRGHSVVYTILKGYQGDSDVIVKELGCIFGRSNVSKRDSCIRIQGNHGKTVLTWLRGLGF